MEAGAVVPYHFLARRRSKYRQVWCSLVQHRRLMRFGVGCGRKEEANDLSPPPEQKDSADPEFKSRYLNFCFCSLFMGEKRGESLRFSSSSFSAKKRTTERSPSSKRLFHYRLLTPSFCFLFFPLFPSSLSLSPSSSLLLSLRLSLTPTPSPQRRQGTQL